MDYDTFVNSAYLRQGHDDEFTRQPPGKRKEVLGNILGLSLYDDLEDRARTLAREFEAENASLDQAIVEIDARACPPARLRGRAAAGPGNARPSRSGLQRKRCCPERAAPRKGGPGGPPGAGR